MKDEKIKVYVNDQLQDSGLVPEFFFMFVIK